MTEEWKRLIYQGNDYGDFYEISNFGEIRNSKTKKIRKKNILHTGYYFVSGSLGSRENKITFKVHKAVSESFILNLNNYPIINHIDGNKLNNNIENLEWCTYKYNSDHAYALGLNKILEQRRKKIVCLELNIEFDSITDCANYLFDKRIIKASCSESIRKKISRVLNGSRNSTGSLHFKYK